MVGVCFKQKNPLISTKLSEGSSFVILLACADASGTLLAKTVLPSVQLL